MGGIREGYGRDVWNPSHAETPFYKGISEENGRDGVFSVMKLLTIIEQ
jgi:hypothetical protein